ncbi:SHOCT domain-containing protein [Gelidibacter salicanalis]|uniref:SHOCT domain-containing protein n=1 Tax=Gelidibacter salicanalis TaxID=291193 RepID=A0A934NKV7_9FLAO|nr:SHOCT domain-containing protein [Gelidibacter salicanalis]MBJ7882602.1 SHOCT domain-containing protein [Gelidibacter salicanalis]
MDYKWDFLIVFGVIILGIFIYAGRKKIKSTMSSKALDLLNERYAKGEITKEEYKKLSKA